MPGKRQQGSDVRGPDDTSKKKGSTAIETSYNSMDLTREDATEAVQHTLFFLLREKQPKMAGGFTRKEGTLKKMKVSAKGRKKSGKSKSISTLTPEWEKIAKNVCHARHLENGEKGGKRVQTLPRSGKDTLVPKDRREELGRILESARQRYKRRGYKGTGV